MSDTEKALNRQEQIWAGLYGPPKATSLIEEARKSMKVDPAASIQDVLASLDARMTAADDDDDLDEAGTMRPI